MLLPDKVGILHCAEEHRAGEPGVWLWSAWLSETGQDWAWDVGFAF